MSRLSRARGIALAWTRVGRAKPASARARSIRGSRICEKEANVAFLSTRWTSAIRVRVCRLCRALPGSARDESQIQFKVSPRRLRAATRTEGAIRGCSTGKLGAGNSS